MNRLEIFRTLRKHVKLAEKRSMAADQNRTAKIIMYVMSGFVIVYMMFISVLLALIANSMNSMTSYEMIFCILPFILAFDFLSRFIAQHTPAQLIKPYILLPIPKYACVESFILSSMTSSNNMLWMFVTVPFAIMSIVFSYGFWAALAFVVMFQLVIVINSLNYMLWRTLINKSIFWWIAPIIIYASPIILTVIGFDSILDIFGAIGAGVCEGNILTYLGIFTVIALFFFINRSVQYHVTYTEATNANEKELKKVNDFSQLDRYGEIGEYLKLEIKSIMRNKNVKKSFIMSICIVVLFSLLISYTDIYSDSFSRKFWIVYTFVLYGAISLIKIMSYEGNYIDCLMSHHENLIQLIRAKYYFYSALLLVPFFLMLPTVFTGKYSLLMLVSMMLFTAGPTYCLLMQMAVYNKQTTPLNEKFIAKGNMENNWFQIVAELIAMFAPVFIISVLSTLFSENVTYIILFSVGLLFVATHKIWIRNIYKRFMARRYENIEAFRASR